jgi:hypothetical protein
MIVEICCLNIDETNATIFKEKRLQNWSRFKIF